MGHIGIESRHADGAMVRQRGRGCSIKNKPLRTSSRTIWAAGSLMIMTASLWAGPSFAQAARPFCDGWPACTKASGPVLDRLRVAWESSTTTDAQRDRMRDLIVLDPTHDWDAIASAYFADHVVADWQKAWATAKNAVLTMLIDPDSAKVEPRSGFGIAAFSGVRGHAVCFTVNAKNMYGGYTGDQFYGVVLDDKGSVIKIDRDNGRYDSHMETQCIVAHLPPINFIADEKPQNAQGGNSIASQMQSLADLHQRGVLTDAEFTAAKAKLLNGSQ
jgi:hypothetical protein